MKIKDIMTRECKWGARNMKVAQAARIMKQQDIGFLPVGCTQTDKIVGAITDRDIILRCIAEGKDPNECSIEDIMTNKVFYCFEDQDAQEVCDNMAEIRVRRLPVMTRDKRLIGVVSFGDIAQASSLEDIGKTQQQLTKECSVQDRRAA